MACCIIMAVILAGLMGIKTWLFCSAVPSGKAQDWRLSTTTETPK